MHTVYRAGELSVSHWAAAMEEGTRLHVPWRSMASQMLKVENSFLFILCAFVL